MHERGTARRLSNEAVLESIMVAMREQRGAAARVIALLIEIEDRRLHLEIACSSTFDFCLRRLGMSEDEAKVYLGAINDSMSSPNMILDLRIPQNQKYQQVVLDEAVSRFLAGEIDKEATVKAVEDGWNELNEEIGKDEQLKLYKATIGAK